MVVEVILEAVEDSITVAEVALEVEVDAMNLDKIMKLRGLKGVEYNVIIVRSLATLRQNVGIGRGILIKVQML